MNLIAILSVMRDISIVTVTAPSVGAATRPNIFDGVKIVDNSYLLPFPQYNYRYGTELTYVIFLYIRRELTTTEQSSAVYVFGRQETVHRVIQHQQMKLFLTVDVKRLIFNCFITTRQSSQTYLHHV